MWGFHDGYSWWWMLFGGMGMFIFWGGLFWLGAAVLSRRPEPAQTAHFDDPELILRRRFAQGELTDEEYHRALTALRDPGIRGS